MKILNNCTITGLLLEKEYEYGSYEKDNNTMPYIRGSVTIEVEQPINGVPTSHEAVVKFFVNKYSVDKKTKELKENSIYKQWNTAMADFVSVAECGRQDAERVTIDSTIKMREYFSENGKLISYPEISGNFIKIAKTNATSEAVFEVQMAILSITPDENSEKEKLIVKGAVPKYGDNVDIITFVCTSPKVISIVNNNWRQNDTVKATGRHYISVENEIVENPNSFGETIRPRTKVVKELVITGGNELPLEGEFAYTPEEISEALTKRMKRLEEQKKTDIERARKRKAPAPSVDINSMGF